MHQVIVSPQHKKYVAVRPGSRGGMQLPREKYVEVRETVSAGSPLPAWFIDATKKVWGLRLDSGSASNTVLVRPETALNYSRATWEINKGCNFACDMCVVWQRPFAGLPMGEKIRLLEMVRDTGVLWFQFTGGEPTIDPDFIESYRTAYDMGMMVEVLTNGSRLDHGPTLETLTDLPPHKVTVSLYGASAETFEALTRTRGAYRRVLRGLRAATAAGLPLELSLIVTEHNAHEVDSMRALADSLTSRTRYSPICLRLTTVTEAHSTSRQPSTSTGKRCSADVPPDTASTTWTRSAAQLCARSDARTPSIS
ncbi:radical SAM protein [Streptomyces dangxiongensis]|uniref:radical SAM protein n=1 Tax=Streptomyces dangxiongensis TaxID=1442032 RepID=UPI001F0971C7|nr:radical SAM protein [Streptomyces dangxiongensis]